MRRSFVGDVVVTILHVPVSPPEVFYVKYFEYCGFCSNRILHYFPLFACVCACHRRNISHFWHIQRHKCHVNNQGTYQTLYNYILNQNHHGYLSSKDQTRQDHLLCPDQPDHWLWLWIIKNINAESAVFTLSCLEALFWRRVGLSWKIPTNLQRFTVQRHAAWRRRALLILFSEKFSQEGKKRLNHWWYKLHIVRSVFF